MLKNQPCTTYDTDLVNSTVHKRYIEKNILAFKWIKARDQSQIMCQDITKLEIFENHAKALFLLSNYIAYTHAVNIRALHQL